MILRQFSNEINMERSPLLKLKGHQNSVECVTYLNSHQISSGDHDGALINWDLETGKQLQKTLIHKEIGIWACESQATFMNRMGTSSSSKNLVVLGSSEKLMSLVDVRQGNGVRCLLFSINLIAKSVTSLTTSIPKIYNINFFQNENLVLASGNKGHVELWDIRKNQMLRSKELSKNPIVYGSRTFNKDKNILLGLENWKGVILDDQLNVLEQKILRDEATNGVVKSLELGKGWCYFGLKNGLVETVETPFCTQKKVGRVE